MTEPAWAQRSRPTAGSGMSRLGQWKPRTAADLSAHRRQVAARLRDATAGADEGAVERLLLVFEELASNALRHGHPPVHVEITSFDRFWLVDVSDAAPGRPPVPAIGRDPATGGLGLSMVVSLCGAHGWTVVGPRKHMWARIDHVRAEAPGVIPRPRDEIAGDSTGV